MANAPEVEPILTPEQAEAATRSLRSFHDSAKDCLKYIDVFAEALETKKALLRTETELHGKVEIIKKLESAISVFILGGNKEVSRVKVENAEANKRLELVTREKDRIKAMLNDAQQSLTKKESEHTKLQKEATELKTKSETMAVQLQNEIATNKEAAGRLGAVERQLGIYHSYTANLVQLNTTSLYVTLLLCFARLEAKHLLTSSKSIERIWARVDSLVKEYFSRDIPSGLLEVRKIKSRVKRGADSIPLCQVEAHVHDEWIQQACSFLRLSSGTIRIPPTNSPAAKFVRQAVVLNIIAQTLLHWIFTAAPLRLAQAGLDDMLLEMMKQDEKKEYLLRAMLISESTETSISEKQMQDHSQSFVDTFGTLLMPKPRTEMKKAFKKLLEEADISWRDSRRTYQKVVATLDFHSFPDLWASYAKPRYQREQSAKQSQTSDLDNDDQVAFLAFPAVILKSKEKETMLHRGVCIYDSDVREAEHEWRKVHKMRRFSSTGAPYTGMEPPLL
jgi:hypothetical protein